jgi:hypothetical protein
VTRSLTKIALAAALIVALVRLSGCTITASDVKSSADDAKRAADCAENEANKNPAFRAAANRAHEAAIRATGFASAAASGRGGEIDADPKVRAAAAALAAAEAAPNRTAARLRAADTAYKSAIDKRVAAVIRSDPERPEGLPADAPERAAYNAAYAAYKSAIDKRVAAVMRLTARRDNGLPEDPADLAAYNAAVAGEEPALLAWKAAADAVKRAHTAADAAAAQAAYDAAHQEEEKTRAEYDAAKAADDAAQAVITDAKAKYDQARVEAAADGANKATDAALQAAGAIPGCSQLVRGVQDTIQIRDILGAGKTPTGGMS